MRAAAEHRVGADEPRQQRRGPSRVATPLAVAAATAAAGGIHLAAGLQHGLVGTHATFFLAAATAQLVLALAIAHRFTRPRVGAAAALNAAVAGVWVVAQMPGGTVDGDFSASGVIATALEVLAMTAAVLVLGRRDVSAAPRTRVRVTSVAVAFAAAAIAVAALPGGGHAHHHHDHGSSTTPAASEPTAEPETASTKAIFGDLFADHHHERSDDDHDHADAEPHEH